MVTGWARPSMLTWMSFLRTVSSSSVKVTKRTSFSVPPGVAVRLRVTGVSVSPMTAVAEAPVVTSSYLPPSTLVMVAVSSEAS